MTRQGIRISVCQMSGATELDGNREIIKEQRKQADTPLEEIIDRNKKQMKRSYIISA